MSFGLTNAPAVFQSLVNDVLKDFLSVFVFVYLDDILIFSKSLEKHRVHVCCILQCLLENLLYVNTEKCEFHSPSVTFLGYTPAGGQVKANESSALVPSTIASSWITAGSSTTYSPQLHQNTFTPTHRNHLFIQEWRQHSGPQTKPCAFFSHRLTSAEQNYYPKSSWCTPVRCYIFSAS